MKKRVLVTGASGFIGQRFIELNGTKYELIPLSLQTVAVEEIDFSKIDCVLHLAGIAHQMQLIDEQIYYDVNHKLTVALAKAAKAAGVNHFLFMSTIKVYGELFENEVLTEKTTCKPEDAYGKSKFLAEQSLQKLESDTFKVSVIRPPLVYGPRVKGNMIRLLQLADWSIPLPFKGITNKRTMVYLDNLVLLCNRIIDAKTSGIFLAGDKTPVSSSMLFATMRKEMNKGMLDFQIPSIIIDLISRLKPDISNRLYGSLELDTTWTNRSLNFQPRYSFEEGIQAMVHWYQHNK